MNERILELADKAIEDMPGAWNIPDEFCKKFAQLIVAECLVTLDSIVCDTSGERDTLWVARKVVADHFGVEE